MICTSLSKWNGKWNAPWRCHALLDHGVDPTPSAARRSSARRGRGTLRSVLKRWTCSPRPLSPPERAVLLALFRAPPVIEDAEHYVGLIDALTVVGGCGCGCASVDFDPSDASGDSRRIGDAIGKT